MATFLRKSYNWNFSRFQIFCLNSLKAVPSPVFTLKSNRIILVADGVFLRKFHLTRQIYGIEEFFPPGVLDSNEPLPEQTETGRSWRAGELRQKSNEDLHKLWYVLLKERNMLLTVQWEARRQNVLMPSPERLHKVKKSMAMIKVVIGERKSAIEAVARRTREKQGDQNLVKGDSEEREEILSDQKELNEQLREVPLRT